MNKREFKKGDKVICVEANHWCNKVGVKQGETYTVSGVDDRIDNVVYIEGNGNGFFYDRFQLVDEADAPVSSEVPKKCVRRFKSGAVRSDDRGRIRPDFISPYALEAIGEHFANQQNDFGAANYELGITPKECNSSIFRHYLTFAKAIRENNQEAIRENLMSLGANIIMALHQVEIERAGLYKEIYDKTEYIDAEEYKKTLTQ